MQTITTKITAIIIAVVGACMLSACEWEYLDKETNTYSINHFSPMAAGTPVRLQCRKSNGSWVTAHTENVQAQNFNANSPDRPVRRVNFSDYKGKMVTAKCGVFSLNGTGWTWFDPVNHTKPCTQKNTVVAITKSLWRLQNSSNNNLVLWDSAEKNCFQDSNQPDLWDRFLECNAGSPNEKETFLNYASSDIYRQVPSGQPGSDGKICK